ncbi:TetR/AcrR family transcriptional regulator [Streptomyces sp. B21-083]|uniref:TetR/AcrR family transcriptional regulator n=1 Tax=Streptomyces sp. B21-083 TaxID=3039410 RepID=UPI002FEF513D
MAVPATGKPAMTRKERAELTRGRLLAAAVDHFTNRPYDEVAVGEIAQAAGTAHGVVFHHFGSKRGLYLEALREVARRLNEIHVVEEHEEPAVLIRHQLGKHLAFMTEHPGFALSLVHGGIGTDPETREIFEETRSFANERLCATLGLDGTTPSLRLTLRAAAGGIDEVTLQWVESGCAFPAERVVDALLLLLASALEGAARLDPGLDVTEAAGVLVTAAAGAGGGH